MNQDEIIAISDTVPADFTNPLSLGALRLVNPADDWVTEAKRAASRGCRIVLSGCLKDPRFVAKHLLEIAQQFQQTRFALLLHWSEAIARVPPPELNGHFDEVYIAVDRALTREQVMQIQLRWSPRWVLLPTLGTDWSTWLMEALFPRGAGGALILLAPKTTREAEFLSADEIRLLIDDLATRNQAIKVEPAPPEWFVPSEIGPWRRRNRSLDETLKIFDTRKHEWYRFAAVVPFRPGNDETEVGSLVRCLNSLRRTFPAPGECEIILAIDGEEEDKRLTRTLHQLNLYDFVMVLVPRFLSTGLLGTSYDEDWRAGFVRNAGVKYASPRKPSSSGVLLFADADVEIIDAGLIRATLCDPRFNVFQLLDESQICGFECATSMLIGIDRKLFESIGGFADAFSHYGAEDNFLVWRAVQAGARIGTIPKPAVRHLREPRETDDLFLKMIRLRNSADLIYRMTLDPKVHRHFYVCVGRHIWIRGAVKWLADRTAGRFLLAPLVFALTLLETNQPRVYLKSFIDKHLVQRVDESGRKIFYFSQHHLRALFLWTYYDRRSPIYWLQTNRWIFREPTAWFMVKTPNFYKQVWRPLLKVRYFLEYHLFVRWRNQ